MASTESVIEVSRFAKVYWGITFFIGTTLTIAVNGAHAKGITAEHGTWMAVFVAMCPPLVFATLTEGYFLVRRAVPVHVQNVVKWAVGVLVVAAFAVSYETSRLFVIAESGPLPSWTGWIIPGMVDTLVAVSGYVLYVLSEHGSGGDVQTSPTHAPSPSSRIASPPTVRPTVPIKPPIRPTAPVKPPNTPALKPPVEREVRVPTPAPIVDGPQMSVAVTEDDVKKYMPAAKWMRHAKLVSRKSDDELVQILKLLDSGKSSNEIRRELNGAATTYDKIGGAWHRWNTIQKANADKVSVTASTLPYGG